ncbi:hypothetical protein [Pedobacter steynii]
MKKTSRISKRIKLTKVAEKTRPGYHFHADEDFREEWNWGKSKMTVSRASSKPGNKFEI